jgi:hypothetical protein
VVHLRALSVAALCLTACVVSNADPRLQPAPQKPRVERADAWTATGFEERTFGWHLAFEDATQRQVLGPSWRLVEEPRSEPLFDVELVNDADDVVWLKTERLAPQDARRKLELIAGDYIHTLSGTTTFERRDRQGRARERTRTIRTVVRDVRETRVGLHRALRLVADLVDTEEAKVNPHARLGQLRVVVARIGYFVKRASKDENVEKAPWPLVQRSGQDYWKKAAVLVVGSVGAVEDPEARTHVDALSARLTFTETSAVIEAPRPSRPPVPRKQTPGTISI